MPVIRKEDLHPLSGTNYPAPYDEGMGNYTAWPFSDGAGLTQFGAGLETLHPGARSSQRHWHENEDEFLYMLEGEMTVIEEWGETIIKPGEAAAWRAGSENGHSLYNHTDKDATYLIVGTRAPRDVCHYSDIDLLYTRDNGVSIFTRRDGSGF